MGSSRILQRCAPALWVAVALIGAGAACAGGLDGWWLASLGQGSNRETVALDFAREPDGSLSARYYSESLGIRGQTLGAVQDLGGNHFTIGGVQIKLQLSPGALRASGFLHDAADTIELHAGSGPPAARALPVAPAGPAPRWSLRLGGSIFAEVAVLDGTAYLGNTNGVFSAITIADGKRLWSFAAGRPIFGQALVTADSVYFVCDDGYLYDLERSGGKQRWRYDLGGERARRILPDPYVFDYEHMGPRPLLLDGVLYAGSGDGSVHAIDARSGQRMWRAQFDGRFRTSAATDGERLYAGNLSGSLYALQRSNGKLLWRRDVPGAFSAAPTVVAGRVLIGARDSMLYAFDAQTGIVAWSQYWWGSWVESSVLSADGAALIGSGDLDAVSSLDPATGAGLWRSYVGGWVLRAPALNAGVLYAGVSGARRNGSFWSPQISALVALDQRTGQTLWRFQPVDPLDTFLHGFVAGPVVAGGLVLVGSVDGMLYALPARR